MSLAIGRGVLGATAGPLVHEVDARWLMAYAACVGATEPAYLDTTRAGGIAAHPLFPVCYEWPLAVELRATRFDPEVAIRSVHATHDVTLHRLPRAGDRLSTTATVIGVEPRPPGAYVLTRHDTVDAAGAPVSRTVYGSLHLGVACEPTPGPAGGPPPPAQERAAPASAGSRPGADPPPGAPPAPRAAAGRAAPAGAWSEPIAVAGNLAHVYTECARIWNPIHTDRAVAVRAGLPDIILHGTATLALAVTRLLARAAVPPAAVRGLACRFGGMVRLPSTLRLEVDGQGAAPRGLAFRVLAADGRPAIRDGVLRLG